MPSTALANPDDSPGQFLALTHELTDIQSFIEDNLAGQDVGEFDLQRITVPSGKASKYRWEVPNLDGGSDVAEEISGIIVFQKQTRAWWPGKPEETGGNTPPSCSSPDAKVGYGKQWATIADPDPEGEPRQIACATCPHSQFGSDGGRGQACKQSAQLFLLRETGFLPAVISIPPTSLRSLKQYMLALANSGIRYSEVVTTLGLEKQSNSGGIDYAQVRPRLGGRLEPDVAAKAKAYAATLRDTFEAAAVTTAADGTDEAAAA